MFGVNKVLGPDVIIIAPAAAHHNMYESPIKKSADADLNFMVGVTGM